MQNTLQMLWSQSITMKQYLYLTQELLFPVCQKCVLKNLIPNLNLSKLRHTKSMLPMAIVLSPLGTAICILEFFRKFQQQFIVCKHLLRTFILELGFSHNYQIGIDLFLPKQLHLHQGPQSLVVSDPTPFPLHINQISTLNSHTS